MDDAEGKRLDRFLRLTVHLSSEQLFCVLPRGCGVRLAVGAPQVSSMKTYLEDCPPTLASPMLLCSVSTLLDLAESTSEENVGCQSPFCSLNQPPENRTTILPTCPPSTSLWKHLPKRIQVTERDTAFPQIHTPSQTQPQRTDSLSPESSTPTPTEASSHST
ncbi:hypothetical protein CRENBAI_015903 [Crenichthys baileyi]|uniref:Uncharacterized protein n=1 Tax=Crenichthys baileyi TaxID=28760 RepID=A0AAV9QVE1_9TELE